MGEARGLTYGLAVGAGLMFVLDPRQGGARRALVRDRSARAVHEVEHATRIGGRDLGHRVEGMVARLFGGDHEPVTDAVLVERVRARLGHVCTHPHAIVVRAKADGEIELKGSIEVDEADRVVAAIARVRGVRSVDDDLARVEHLPGHEQIRARQVQGLGRAWNPTTRLVLGAASLGLALSSLLRARPLGFALGSAGVLGLARSMVTRGATSGARGRLGGVARAAKQVVGGEGLSPKAEVVGGGSPDGEPIVGLTEAYRPGSAWNPPNTLDADREAPASGDAIDR